MNTGFFQMSEAPYSHAIEPTGKQRAMARCLSPSSLRSSAAAHLGP